MKNNSIYLYAPFDCSPHTTCKIVRMRCTSLVRAEQISKTHVCREAIFYDKQGNKIKVK